MLELLVSPEAWIAFVTLTALELVWGSTTSSSSRSSSTGCRPRGANSRARSASSSRCSCGSVAAGAVVARGLTSRSSRVEQEISGRDSSSSRAALSALEEHDGDPPAHGRRGGRGGGAVKATFTAVIVQIVIIDIVFSLDSIITAVGMVQEIAVMVAAVIASVG
jgi:predicted tellurium resistance membrane protein TerC